MGRLMATETEDSAVHIFDVGDPEPLMNLTTHENADTGTETKNATDVFR